MKITKAMERALQQARERERNEAAGWRQARHSFIEQSPEYSALRAEVRAAHRVVQDAETEHGRLCNQLSALAQRLGKEWDEANKGDIAP